MCLPGNDLKEGGRDINTLSVHPLRNFMLASLLFERNVCVSKWSNIWLVLWKSDSFTGDRSCICIWKWSCALMLSGGITSILLNIDPTSGSGNSLRCCSFVSWEGTCQRRCTCSGSCTFPKYLLLAAVGDCIDFLYL